MDQQIQEHGLEPYTQTVVVLLHGILRARSSMDDMKHFLQRFGHQVISVSYASSRESIDDHARSLRDVLDDHKEIDRIHVVAHSMGALVKALDDGGMDISDAGDCAGVLVGVLRARLGRLVVLGSG